MCDGFKNREEVIEEHRYQPLRKNNHPRIFEEEFQFAIGTEMPQKPYQE